MTGQCFINKLQKVRSWGVGPGQNCNINIVKLEIPTKISFYHVKSYFTVSIHDLDKGIHAIIF